MHLRNLEIKDAPLMLEWMHDSNVTKYLNANFADKTLEDAEAFIRSSANDIKNINLAVLSTMHSSKKKKKPVYEWYKNNS